MICRFLSLLLILIGSATDGMEWMIDETLDRLIRERKVRPTIVVGIWNTPKRKREYELSWASRVEIPLRFLLPPHRHQRRRHAGGA